MDFLQNISIGIQNMNSLNISNSDMSKDTLAKKCVAITLKGEDIIFLSDVRIPQGDSCKNLINKAFWELKIPYNIIYNSKKAKRGTAIIYKRDLELKIAQEWRDDLGNILLAKVYFEKYDKCLILGSVYGENKDNAKDFFNFIDKALESIAEGDRRIILGGDWNTVFDQSDVGVNIDIINMKKVPNRLNSFLLGDLCQKFELSDPFRCKYPNKREYSYVPFGDTRPNRSRIDLFVCSIDLMRRNFDVVYKVRTSRLFDHKKVVLTFGKKVAKQGGEGVGKIDFSNLHHPEIKQIIKHAATETYIRYTSNPQKVVWMENLERINLMLFRKEALRKTLVKWDNGLNDQQYAEYCNLLQNISEEIDNRYEHLLPNVENCDLLDIEIEKSTYFWCLLNEIRNRIISFQKCKTIEQNEYKLDLQRLLGRLKRNYVRNFSQIANIEKKITILEEEKLREQFKLISKFRNLEFEKCGKQLCKWGKMKRKGEDISVIKRHLGGENYEEFISLQSRDDYICDFFENIYKTNPEIGGEIGDFLGGEGLQTFLNSGQPLKEEEKFSFERKMTVQEAKKFLLKANKTSASGADDISYVLLEKTFNFTGYPLISSFNEQIENGVLNPELRVSKIKLIPKKGNLSQINNWRSISLLSCIYKVYSGILANRLKERIHVLVHKDQKGFMRRRKLQEIIYNIHATISAAKFRGKNALITFIDFSKAFDKLSRQYMLKVLKLYNFGPYFTKMVKVALTDRIGYIVTPEGKTRNFMIEDGTMQGDVISPLLFSLSAEILSTSLRVKLKSPNIFVRELDAPLTQSYADDLSCISESSEESIDTILEETNKFKKLSGLEINTSKTKVFLVGGGEMGHNERIETYCKDKGLEVDGEAKLLGYTLSSENKEITVQKNWSEIIEKMNSQVRIWGLYNLTLPGRINIAKCMILSQIVFFGSVFIPKDEVASLLQNKLNDFVKGGMKLRNNEIITSTGEGGLGIMNVHHMMRCIQAVFFKKNLINRDLWSNIIRQSCLNSDIEFVHEKVLNEKEFPLLFDMVKSVNLCKNLFNNLNGNIFKSNIFYNDLIKDREGNIIERFSSDARWQLIKLKANKFVFGKLLAWNNQGNISGVLDKAGLENVIEMTLSREEYRELKNILMFNSRKYKNRGGLSSVAFWKFYFRIGTTSRALRVLKVEGNIRSSSYFNYFKEKLGEPPTNIEFSKLYFSSWKVGYFSYELSNFFYNFSHNKIMTNDRLSKFSDTDRSCPGCRLKKQLPAQSDSLMHGYFFCPLARMYIEIYEKFSGYTINEQNFFWGAYIEGMNKVVAFFLNLDLMILKYFIHTVRSSTKAPPAISALIYVKSQKKIMRACSIKFERLCRNMERKQFYVGVNNSDFTMY